MRWSQSLVTVVRSRLGFHGCCTSLQYWAPCFQSFGRPCAVACSRRITCADVVAKLARYGPEASLVVGPLALRWRGRNGTFPSPSRDGDDAVRYGSLAYQANGGI